MTSTEPVTPTADAAGLPTDPVRYRRKGLGLWFWLAIVYGIICIALGVFVARLAPALFPAEKAEVAQPAAQTARPAFVEPVTVTPPAPLPEPAAVPQVAIADASSVSGRLAELEAGQNRTLAAASAALATSALLQAAQTSRPFAAELAAVEPLLPASRDAAELRRLAQTGAPTRAALAAEFPAAAARAIAASRAPEAGAGLLDRARHTMGRIVTIRRVDNVEGSGPHAVLARAEAKVEEGDIEGALAELDALPTAAGEAMAAWRARAQRRAEIDRRLNAVREASLRTLSAATGGGA